MKSFTRIKKIHGLDYLYEITPYYDPETKKIKQRSRYLGKNINGTAVKVFSQGVIPKKILSYGEFMLLNKIVEDLNLEQIISGLLSEKETWSILTIAFNHLVHPRAMTQIQSWYEGTSLSNQHPNLPLSSQSLSNLLDSIGNRGMHLDLSKKLIENQSTSSTLIYDITSLSSYSQKISLLEFGYSRDNPDLPQINLSLIVDQVRGIPVMYDLYPGSIVDVSTLKNTIQKLHAVGIPGHTLILDRGFFSTPNIEELISNKLSFIIAASNTLKSVKQAISTIHGIIDDPNYLRIYEKEPLFVMPVQIEIGERLVNGYAYYDQNREQRERNSFYKRLNETVEKLQKIDLKPWMNPHEVFKEVARRNQNYIIWTVVDQKFDVSVKKNAVAQHVNRMGKMILLYDGIFSWEPCLSLYKSRDAVEKAFSLMKNDLEVMPLNVKKESTLKGYLLVCFIALLISMRLSKMMSEANLVKKYSIDGIFTELEKIKLIVMPDERKIVSEITKRQKDILNALGLCA
jgi:transposase